MNCLQDFAEANNRTIAALTANVGLTNGNQIFTFWNLPLVSVHLLGLHDEHRVFIADGALQQALHVIGREWCHHLQAGHGCVKAFVCLAVRRSQLSSLTIGSTENHGTAVLTTAHLKHLGCVVDDLIARQNSEIPSHKLHNGSKAIHGCSHSDGAESQLADGRIDHPIRPEFLQHSFGGFVGSVVLSDFFAKEEYPVISTHFFAHGLTNGLAILNGAHTALVLSGLAAQRYAFASELI